MSPQNPFSRMFGQSSSDDSAEAALRREVAQLQESVESLSILNDLTLAMTRTIDPEKAVEKLIDSSMRAVNAEQATVKLLGHDTSNPLETRIDINVSSAEHMAYRVDDNLLGWMLLQDPPRTLVLNDPGNDDNFRGVAWDKSIRSVICLPLTVKSELFGILTLYNKRGETGFTGDDTKLLSVIAANAAQILENTRLIKQTNRLEEQLNLAAEIQATLLPDSPPKERIARSNTLLWRSIDDEHFVTMWYCVLNAGAHQLVYCSAGHEHPFLVSANGACRRLDKGGLALGVFENTEYEQQTVGMQPGDVLVIYSDGVTDATTVTDEPFGGERLQSVIVDNRTGPARAIVRAIFSAVETHADNADQFDDLTAVVVKRAPLTP